MTTLKIRGEDRNIREFDRPAHWYPRREAPSDLQVMARYAIAFLAAILAFVVCMREASAQTTACAWSEDCLSWDRPTTYTDESPLNATDIASYVVEAAPANSTTWTQLATVLAPTQAYKRVGLKNGDAFQYRVLVVMKSGVRSAPSEVKNATTTEPPPNPAVLRAIDQVAFEIKPNSTGTLVATRVGLVPTGTQCMSERQQKVGATTYTLVPRGAVDMVNWPANVKLQDVWAKCG